MHVLQALCFWKECIARRHKIAINFGCDTMTRTSLFSFVKSAYPFVLQATSTFLPAPCTLFHSAVQRRGSTRERFLDSIQWVERLFCFYFALDALLTCPKAVFILLLFDDGGSLISDTMEGRGYELEGGCKFYG
jgi:hypothetical protein